MRFPFPINPNEVGGNPAVGFLSPICGAGATTLACLTALSFAEAGKKVALVDLSPAGKVRTYMGLTIDICPSSVLDVAGVKDHSEIHRAGVIHPRSLFVIPGIVRPLDVQQLNSNLISKTLAFLRKEFELTIAVLPPIYDAGWLGVLICDLLCCVLKPDRVDLDYYRGIVDLLSRLGCGERIRIVLNQNKAPGSLREEELKRIFKPDAIFDYEPSIRVMCNKRYLNTGLYKKQLLDLLKEGVSYAES